MPSNLSWSSNEFIFYSKGQTFSSSCTTSKITEISVDVYSMTTCEYDFDAIQNDDRIKTIEEEKIVTTLSDEDVETEIPGDEEEFE